ncbi:MAG: hypothetical protein V4671_18680 [Armatimonadota bacterium]
MSTVTEQEKLLRDYYRRATILVQNDDYKGLADLLEGVATSDWTATDANGESHPIVQQLQLLRSDTVLHPANVGQYAYTVKKISFHGDTAYVDAVQKKTTIEVDTEGKYGTKGKKHRITSLEPTRDTWVKLLGKWKLRNSRSFRMLVEVDGKAR